MSQHAPQLRSLYRRLLRELPTRKPSLLASPSPLQHEIRSSISTAPNPDAPSTAPQDVDSQLQAADQFVQYVKAQRMYITLLERYNPGANMNEEERVKLSARRVGMDLPEEFKKALGGGKG